MSYEKAMKHARNVRKCRKQSRMHFGFDSCSHPTPSIWTNKRFVVGQWFKDRHTEPRGLRYVRECIRETIAEIRAE